MVDLNGPLESSALGERRAVGRGVWDHSQTLILRGRVEREAPGVLVATPLRLAGRPEAVMVIRGFVPADDALRPDPALISRPDSGDVNGLLLPVPVTPDSGGRLVSGGSTTWARLDAPTLYTRLPYPILDVYLHALPDGEPRAAPWPMPVDVRPLDDGPHLSYMVQWFGIAAAALAFGVIILKGGTGSVRAP